MASAALDKVKVSALKCGLWAVAQTYLLFPIPGDPQIATRVDQDFLDPGALQRLYRPIYCVALGDAAQVQAHRPPKAHARAVCQMDVAPVSP